MATGVVVGTRTSDPRSLRRVHKRLADPIGGVGNSLGSVDDVERWIDVYRGFLFSHTEKVVVEEGKVVVEER